MDRALVEAVAIIAALILVPVILIFLLRPRYRATGKPMWTEVSAREAASLVGGAVIGTVVAALLHTPRGIDLLLAGVGAAVARQLFAPRRRAT